MVKKENGEYLGVDVGARTLYEKQNKDRRRRLRVVSLKWLQLGSGASFLPALLVPNLTIHWTNERRGLTILLNCRPNCNSESFYANVRFEGSIAIF